MPIPTQTVLIVDDDEMWRMLARVALGRAGFRCEECGSVKEAMTVLGREPVFCIVTDLLMPELDGLDLCRMVRADPEFADTPIIVMTSSIDEAEHRTAREAGAHTTLRKDVEFKQVVSAVRFSRNP
ncbi:MAG: response regulator [Candidatus Methylophosphatis roskildensis]